MGAGRQGQQLQGREGGRPPTTGNKRQGVGEGKAQMGPGTMGGYKVGTHRQARPLQEGPKCVVR